VDEVGTPAKGKGAVVRTEGVYVNGTSAGDVGPGREQKTQSRGEGASERKPSDGGL
jgi:hypothetical protein